MERYCKVVAVLNVKTLGGVKLWLHSFLSSAIDEGDFLAKVTLPPGKEPYRLGMRLVGLQSPSRYFSKEKKLNILAGTLTTILVVFQSVS